MSDENLTLEEQVKKDQETIMKAGLYFGEELLYDYGEFYPYGFALKKDGGIHSMGTYDGDENPSSEAVIQQLKDIFIQSAKDENIVLFAVFYDVEITEEESDDETSAIAAFTEHREGKISQTLYHPYKLEENKVVFNEEENFVMDGEREIFVEAD